MANTTAERAISASLPASGRTLLADITNDRIWADATLQYYLGGADTLNFDAEFRVAYEGAADDYYQEGSNPDAPFAYIDQMVRAYQMIDSVIATDFTRVTNAATAQTTADLVVITSDDAEEPLEGFFQLPESATRAADDYWSLGTITSDLDYMNTAPEAGGGEYLNWTLIHEAGHGIGLFHPFSGGATRPSVGAALDDERYTVMSYTGATDANAYGHAVTMMALDVAALQQQYGTETYATGNSTYTLLDPRGGALRLGEGDMAIGRAYATIWDSGGAADEINYAGNANSVLINLNDATLDRSGVAAEVAPSLTALQYTAIFDRLSQDLQTETTDANYNAGGFFSRVMIRDGEGTYAGIDGGFAIANGALIENAVGGADADLLIGNEQANSLRGEDGDDVVIGGRGDDRLFGGEGCDTAAFSGAQADYEITENDDGSVTVVHSGGTMTDGSDTLRDIEFLQFSDARLGLAEAEALTLTEITSNAFIDFGANTMFRNDDQSQLVDISPIFEEGIVIDDVVYDGVYLNTNGNITFGSGLSTYTPQVIGGGSNNRIIAPYWADVDTRNPTDGTNPGSIYWDYNADRDSLVFTWEDVGYYSRRTDLLSSFQLELLDRGCGNVEMIFRYEDISWTAGGASGGVDGLGGFTSRAGFSLGEILFELPSSGNESAMLGLDSSQGNTGVSGVWQFAVAGGAVQGVGGNEGDVYTGTDGNDVYEGNLGDDIIDGGAGNDTLSGGAGNDRVRGGDGDDRLSGGDGADTVNGGAGNDLIYGGDTDADLRDVIYGGDGDDRIDGGYGNDLLNGGAGADVMEGGFGADTLIGNAGNDVLTGSAFGDLIFGNDGFDFINGGFGSDRVNGGAGADRFFHVGVAGHGSDWIQDYSGAGRGAKATVLSGAAALPASASSR